MTQSKLVIINDKRIRVTAIFPPIDVRDYDYIAIDYDDYEPGSPVGHGKTEEDAIKDLLGELEEAY